MVKKKDILLIAALLLVGGIVLLFAVIGGQGGKSVLVRINGEKKSVYPLNENRRVELNGEGGRNILVIEDGTARIEDADCPDKLCVRQGRISLKGQSVICLPHKTVIEITDDFQDNTDSGVDVIVK